MTTHFPQQASDFEDIYYPNGTCGARYDCSKQGVVLAYDTFSPEVALWFCEECWQWANEDMPADWLSIVEDKRPFVLFFQAIPDIAAMKIVEDIFHYENAGNDEEDESHDEEIERLEDILEEAGYSYVGINSMVYLYNKEEDIIADLDTDEYSWRRAHEDFDPIAENLKTVEGKS